MTRIPRWIRFATLAGVPPVTPLLMLDAAPAAQSPGTHSAVQKAAAQQQLQASEFRLSQERGSVVQQTEAVQKVNDVIEWSADTRLSLAAGSGTGAVLRGDDSARRRYMAEVTELLSGNLAVDDALVLFADVQSPHSGKRSAH